MAYYIVVQLNDKGNLKNDERKVLLKVEVINVNKLSVAVFLERLNVAVENSL